MTPQDKRYQEYREACDKILCVTIYPWTPDDERKTYLLDGEIDAVVRKLESATDGTLENYAYQIALIVLGAPTPYCRFSERDIALICQASAEQKAEALARTIMGEE